MLSPLHALSVTLYRNYSILNNSTTVYVCERALSIVSDVNIKRDYWIMSSQSMVQVFYHWVQARIFNHHNMFDYVVRGWRRVTRGKGCSCYSQSLLRTHAHIKDNPILFCLARYLATQMELPCFQTSPIANLYNPPPSLALLLFYRSSLSATESLLLRLGCCRRGVSSQLTRTKILLCKLVSCSHGNCCWVVQVWESLPWPQTDPQVFSEY